MLDVRAVTLLADYFVICEGTSARQIKAIVEGIQESLREQKVHSRQVEGVAESGWVLLDYSDVIVHVFSPEQRAFYKLEELWQEAPIVVRMF